MFQTIIYVIFFVIIAILLVIITSTILYSIFNINIVSYIFPKKFLSFFFNKKIETFYDKNTEIPPYFFQIWINPENKVPTRIRDNFEKIRDENKDIECKLFKGSDCTKFLEKYYEKDVQDAYKKIVPGAFKADLMRYCILYIKGGIYLDAKMKPINNFKLEDVLDKEYFVRDFKDAGGGVCNGFIVCKPRNKRLLDAINEIVENVENRFYGNSSLEPTGPLLLKKFFTGKEIELFELEYTINPNSPEGSEPILIISREHENADKAILEKDTELVNEQSNNRQERNYGDLWDNQNIYKTEGFTSYYV